MSSRYYLVPFGRERGSYLDVLGLPPDASEAVVARRDVEYRFKMRDELRDKCRVLRAERDQGTITQEEFDAETQQLQEAKNKRETKLNELKAAHEATKAQMRALKRGGHQVASGGWAELFRGLDGDAATLWSVVRQRRPLPQLSEERVRQIEAQWVSAPVGANSRPGTDRDGKSQPVRLSSISALQAERDVIPLLLADFLWRQAICTNRDYWRRQVRMWHAEIQRLGPRLHLRPVRREATRDRRDYPQLRGPRNRAIDRLEPGEVADVAGRPAERLKDSMDFDTFLALLHELGATDPSVQSGKDPARGGAFPSSLLDDLRKLMASSQSEDHE